MVAAFARCFLHFHILHFTVILFTKSMECVKISKIAPDAKVRSLDISYMYFNICLIYIFTWENDREIPINRYGRILKEKSQLGKFRQMKLPRSIRRKFLDRRESRRAMTHK